MEKSEIKAKAEAYCDNPKSWRKSDEGQKAFAKLPVPVQAKVREMLEGRRGFRRVNGVIEFSKEGLVAEIARLEEKSELYDERKTAIKKLVKERKAELAERFGGDNE